MCTYIIWLDTKMNENKQQQKIFYYNTNINYLWALNSSNLERIPNGVTTLIQKLKIMFTSQLLKNILRLPHTFSHSLRHGPHC